MQPNFLLKKIDSRRWIRDENGDVILGSYDPTNTGIIRPQKQVNQCNSTPE
jgi:hypothetical protein